jgi:hypothetical protein
MDWETAGFYPQWSGYALMVRNRDCDPPSWVKAIPYIARTSVGFWALYAGLHLDNEHY